MSLRRGHKNCIILLEWRLPIRHPEGLEIELKYCRINTSTIDAIIVGHFNETYYAHVRWCPRTIFATWRIFCKFSIKLKPFVLRSSYPPRQQVFFMFIHIKNPKWLKFSKIMHLITFWVYVVCLNTKLHEVISNYERDCGLTVCKIGGRRTKGYNLRTKTRQKKQEKSRFLQKNQVKPMWTCLKVIELQCSIDKCGQFVLEKFLFAKIQGATAAFRGRHEAFTRVQNPR